MPPRRGRPLPALCVLLLLCGPAPAREPAPPDTPARRLWKQGQEALVDGRPQEAAALFERSLQLDPDLADNHLSLAAAWLARDDEAKAAACLERYLERRPDPDDGARANQPRTFPRRGGGVLARPLCSGGADGLPGVPHVLPA